MKYITRILLIAACLTGGAVMTLAAPAEASAEIIDRIVARINDEIITEYELEQAATPFLLQNGMDPSVLDDPQQREQVLERVLDELVEQRLLLQEAAKLDMSVSEDEVDQWMAYTRQQQSLSEEQFREMIQQYGMSYSTYRDMIRQNLLRLRLVRTRVGQQVSITDEEVEQAYRERFGGQNSRDKHIEVRHVLVRPQGEGEQAVEQARQQAEEARQKIASGDNFAEVARAYSNGPSSDQGGYLGTFSRGDLDPSFEEVAFDLDKGELSQVVRTQFGFHVIEVMDVQYRADDNVEERKEQLRAQLQQEAVERQLQSYVQNLRARSFIEVKY